MLAEQAVLLEAIAAYTAVVRDRRVLELARGNEERLRLELAATRDRERFGDLTETDIHQAESRHEGGIAERVAAEGALAVSEADYAQAIGAKPGDLEPAPLPEYAPPTLEAAMAEAEGNWAWQAAVFDLDAAREAVAVSLAAMKPRLMLGGEVGYAAGRRPAVRLRRQALRSAPRSPCRSTRAAASMPGCGRARSS